MWCQVFHRPCHSLLFFCDVLLCYVKSHTVLQRCQVSNVKSHTALHQCQVSQFYLSVTRKYCFPTFLEYRIHPNIKHTTITHPKGVLILNFSPKLCQSAIHEHGMLPGDFRFPLKKSHLLWERGLFCSLRQSGKQPADVWNALGLGMYRALQVFLALLHTTSTARECRASLIKCQSDRKCLWKLYATKASQVLYKKEFGVYTCVASIHLQVYWP